MFEDVVPVCEQVTHRFVFGAPDAAVVGLDAGIVDEKKINVLLILQFSFS